MRRVDFEEDRRVLLEDFAVGARGDIFSGGKCVENDAGAAETARANALKRKQGVVDAAETVCDDDDDRQGKAGSEVGDGFLGRNRHEPATGTLDEEGWIFLGEGAEPVPEGIERDAAVFESGGDERGGGLAKPDGVDLIEGQAAVRCGLQDFDIRALAATEWLERNSFKASGAEGAGEECCDEGLSGVGVGAGDEEVHLRSVEGAVSSKNTLSSERWGWRAERSLAGEFWRRISIWERISGVAFSMTNSV